MKEAAHPFVTLIHVAEGPAAKSGDGNGLFFPFVEGFGVLPEESPHDVFVLEVFIAGGTYGWTTCKA